MDIGVAQVKAVNDGAKCKMILKYDNKYIDNKLIGRNIQRLTDCFGVFSKCEWKCLVDRCGHIWQSSPNKIINSGQGCRKCAGNMSITSDEFDDYLASENLQRLGSFLKIRSIFKIKCLEEGCNYIWEIKGSSIYKNSGCPKCSKCAKLTNEIIDERLIGRNIQRIGNYVNAKSKLELKCLVEGCDYIWFANSDNSTNSKKGCPKCANCVELTNEIIDERLKNRKIKRIGNCEGVHSKIEWQCLKNTNHIWTSEINEVINAMSGCPICPYKNQSILFDVLKSLNVSFEHQKDIRKIDKEARHCIVDFYIPRLNLFIEYNGPQHYEPVRFGSRSQEEANDAFVKQQARDEYMRQFCINNSINLEEVDGRIIQFKKIKPYMKELIARYLQTQNK